MSDLNGKLALLNLKETQLLEELETIRKQQQQIYSNISLYEELIPALQLWAIDNLKNDSEKEYIVITIYGDGSGDVNILDFWRDIVSINQESKKDPVFLEPIKNDNS